MTLENTSSSTSGMVKTAAFVIVVAGMMAAETIINPILLALFIAIICGPALEWLKQKKVGTGMSVAIVFIGISLILFVLTLIFANSVSNFISKAPQYESKLEVMADNGAKNFK